MFVCFRIFSRHHKHFRTCTVCHTHTHTEPYSVTTIGSRDNGLDPHIPNPRRSESPLPRSIPPPSIIRQSPRESDKSDSNPEIYYSNPSDMAERGGGRALNDEGVFVDTQRMSVSSGDSGREPGVRPLMGDRELCVCVVMPDMGHWSGCRWGESHGDKRYHWFLYIYAGSKQVHVPSTKHR